MLGIQLTDFDVGSVPLLRTDPYGNFIPERERFRAGHHRHRRRRHSEHGRRRRRLGHARRSGQSDDRRRHPHQPRLPRRHRARRGSERQDRRRRHRDRPGQPGQRLDRVRQRAARRPLHRRRRPRQREHRPDRRPPRVPCRAQPAWSSRPRTSCSRPADLAFINEWLRHRHRCAADHPGADRRPGLGRRAPVPGREVHHRDAVPASGVRGVRAQGPAADQPLRRAGRLRHHDRSVDRGRVRARGLSLRPLDADRVDRPLRPELQRTSTSA